MSGVSLIGLITYKHTNIYKTNISENTHFDIKYPVNKIVLEWSIYPIEPVKI